MLAVVALEVPLARTFADRVDAEIRGRAAAQADLLASAAGDTLAAPGQTGDIGAPARLRDLAASAARSTRGRVVVVDARGRILADSAGARELGADYGTRPEIAEALRGRRTSDERESATLGQRLVATAVPVKRGGRTLGAVRITQSVSAARRAERRVIAQLVLVGVVVLAVGLGAGAVIARKTAAPIRRLEAVARRVSGGELGVRAPVEGSAEQRSLARSFNEMTQRLARTLEAQQRFVADASHQLRSPLTAVRLRVEEARAGDPSPAAQSHLERAEREIDRLGRTIDELLVLSEAGEAAPTGQTIDLRAAAADALERWEGYAGARGVRLELESPNGGGAAWCSPGDLARMLDALVENAVKYTRPATRVVLAVCAGGVEVRDEGPGFAEGEIEHVFERFHRGRAGSDRPGTGLGLPIARALAARWGGEVTVANRAGGGAIARLRLGA